MEKVKGLVSHASGSSMHLCSQFKTCTTKKIYCEEKKKKKKLVANSNLFIYYFF